LWVLSAGHEVIGDYPIDPGQQLTELQLPPILVHHCAEGLYEPGSKQNTLQRSQEEASVAL